MSSHKICLKLKDTHVKPIQINEPSEHQQQAIQKKSENRTTTILLKSLMNLQIVASLRKNTSCSEVHVLEVFNALYSSKSVR